MADVMNQLATDIPTAHFPDDVLIEIFLRLPVKSLFLLRSVCKHWLHIIQTPHFILWYNNRPINNLYDQQPLLIVRSIKLEWEHEFQSILLTFLSDDETLAYKDDVLLGLVSPSMASRGVDSWGSNFVEGKFHLLGPCNGLFCITDSVDVVLLNPATRQSRKVSQSPLSPRTRMWYHMDAFGYFDCVGFGFDSTCNDYKVVRFEEINLREYDENSDCHDDDDTDEDDDDTDEDDDDDNYEDDGLHYHHFKIKIFSLSTDCWTELECVVPTDYRFRIRSRNLFFNGAFYWLGGDNDTIYSILVFDLSKKDFKRFQLPGRYCEIEEEICVKLLVLNEALALIVHDDLENSIFDAEFDIWVMAKYELNTTWSKLYNITVFEGIKRPLSFSNNNEFLLENHDGQLVSFNLNTWETTKFEVHGISGLMHAFRYRESLVSLH